MATDPDRLMGRGDLASTLRWGVLGTAGIARAQVVPAIQASQNGRVTAVAGRDASRARDFATTFGIPAAFDNYEALLASSEVDAVYIPLPNDLHAEWSLRALAAGKAVLCEKPLATSAKAAAEVVDAFAAKNVPLMEGFMYRFHPQNRHVLKLIDEGAIGEVREVRAHLSVRIMDPPDAGNIRFKPEMGGGSLLDMGCYTVNVARGILGAEPHAVFGRLDMNPALGIDVSASAVLEFEDGRSALISSSFKAGGQGAYQVIGSKGTIEVPRAIIPGMGTRVAEGLVILADEDGRRSETRFEPVDQYRIMVEAFADAVLSGRPVPYDPADGVKNLAVCDAIVASHRVGKRVEVQR
jgi:predicted dehydrogenase